MGVHVFPILNPLPTSLPNPSLWVILVHQPWAPCIMHRTWTADSFLIFLKRSILLFSSISLHWSLRKSFLSLLAVIWNSAFNGYICPFLLCIYLLFFSHYLWGLLRQPFCLFAFLFLGLVLITASCTMTGISIHSTSSTLSIISNPLNLFVTSTV